MADSKDKRVRGQDASLRGLSWVYGLNHRFASNPHWDNNHCSICKDDFKTIDPADIRHEGYTSLGGQHWVCARCFHDCKDMFGWSIHNWD